MGGSDEGNNRVGILTSMQILVEIGFNLFSYSKLAITIILEDFRGLSDKI